MNNYEDWAHLVAKKLKGEGDVIAAIDKDELDDSDAAEVFVRTVLKSFLPENYGIGAGRVVDAFGNRSDYMDVVIYNRSFPRIGMRGTQSDYLYESVLATFVIRAKYVRKTFFESMDACASMARLMTNVDKTVLVKLARRNGLKPGPNRTFIHEDPLRTARFELIGSPPAFMFGFSGIKTSYRQLQENIELWIEKRREENVDLPMRAFPAVIATQGCFAWRNAAPLALTNREMMGIGNDDAPIRLIVLQLLYLLNRRLNVTTDGYGLKPNLSSYLSQFSAPNFERGIGDVDTLINLRLAKGDNAAADQEKRLQPARDHTDSAQADTQSIPAKPTTGSADDSPAEPAAWPTAQPAAKPDPSPLKQAAAVASANVTSTPAPATEKSPDARPESNSPGVFDKPSPFASAPAPAAKADETEATATPWAPAAPLGSAPFSGMASTADKDKSTEKPPVATLGSAPIPDMASTVDKDKSAAKPPAASLGSAPIPTMQPAPEVKPPMPAIDIEVAADIPLPGGAGEKAEPDFESTMVVAPEPGASSDETSADADKIDEEPDFESTVVIAPDATLSNKPAGNSTNSFINRVKDQLSGPENSTEDKEQAFISTTPV